MIGKLFKYNGTSIPWTATEGQTAGWYADVSWKGLSTENSQINRQDFHGVIANPTFARGRLISIRGEIFDTSKTKRGTIRNIIDDLFLVEAFPIGGNEFKKLEFTDDDGSEWFIRAKVYSMPDYENDRADAIVNFNFDLFAEDPLIRSKDLQSVAGIYGVLGGATLPLTIPADLSGAINIITATNAGNFPSPALITITGTITNPKITNMTTGKFWKMNITMVAGDILIVDTENGTATLNGVSTIANRATGSNWIFINSGANLMVMSGDNFDIDDQSKATYTVQFYNTKI